MPNPGMRAMVPPVATEPMRGGLLTGCVPVVTATDMHELNGTESMSGGCLPVSQWQDCPSGTWGNPEAKEFARPELVTSDPITAYSGVECSTFGLSQAEAEAMALEALRRGESYAVEDFFLRQVLCPLAQNLSDLPDQTVPVSARYAVALLEEFLSDNLFGQGYFLAGVGAAAVLMGTDAFHWNGEGCPTTMTGNKLVAGNGFTRGMSGDPCAWPTEPGQAWVYAVPSIRVRRDERHVVPSGQTGSINRTTNDRRVLAESTFVVEMACARVGAVLIDFNL